MAFKLKEKKCFSAGTKVTFHRTRESELLSYFGTDEGLVFYLNVEGLLLKIEIPQHIFQVRRLFIDSSKRSL